jgi:hypothetical protein
VNVYAKAVSATALLGVAAGPLTPSGSMIG